MHRAARVCLPLPLLAPTLFLACSSGGGAPGGGGGTGGSGNPDGGAGGAHNPLTQALIDQFVSAHNQARSGPLTPPPAPPLPPVAWDPVLADTAHGYLSRCVSTDHALIDHNANRTTDYAARGGSGYVGENIFGSTGSSTPAAAITTWMSEASQFDYATTPSAPPATTPRWCGGPACASAARSSTARRSPITAWCCATIRRAVTSSTRNPIDAEPPVSPDIALTTNCAARY